MRNLIWTSNNYGWVTNDAGQVLPLPEKPALSFAFDAIYLEQTNQFKLVGNERIDLTDAEITECNSFIDAHQELVPQLIMGVSEKGKYLGWVTPDKAYKQVLHAPSGAENYRYDFNTGDWIYIRAVNADGAYVGNVAVDDPQYAAEVPSLPPFPYSVWDFTVKDWKDGRTLEQLKADLCNQLDALADQRSLKYVTPGVTQAARYQQKISQCQAYKAAGYPYSAYPQQIDPTDYPYIYWEANQTGQTGQAMADNCIRQAAAWDDKGGQLEGYRVGGKTAINKAADSTSAQAAYDTAAKSIGTV